MKLYCPCYRRNKWYSRFSYTIMEHDIETLSATINIDDSIVFVRIKQNCHLTLAHAVENLKAMEEISKVNGPILALVDSRGVKSTTKQHRDYFATDRVKKIVKVAAMLVGSPLSRSLGNMFLKITRPPVESRLFTSEINAREWLSSYK